jgi:hypothetical protein
MTGPLKNHKITLFLKRIKIVVINLKNVHVRRQLFITLQIFTYALTIQMVKRKITIFLGIFFLQKIEY